MHERPSRFGPEAVLVRWLFRSAAGHDEPAPHWNGSPDDLARRLTHHRGWTLLARRLDQVPGLPDGPAAEARARRRQAAARQLAVAADLATIGRALDGAGIAWAVVKGPVLAAAYQRAGEARAYSDLDVLVAPPDFERALERLQAAGASLVDRNFELLRSVVPGEVAVRAAHGTLIDLHWSLVNKAPRRSRLSIGTAPLLARAQSTPLLGSPVPVLPAAESLVHLCLHAAASGAGRAGWLLDVALTARDAGPAWPDVVAVAREWHVAAPVGVVLQRCRRHLGLDVPADALRELLGRGGWAAADAAASWAGDPWGCDDPYWAAQVAVGAVDSAGPASLVAVKARRVVTSPRRRTRFVQSPDDPGSALFASGTDEDLRAYLRTVAAQPS